jgi:hypothetical protein
MPCMDARRKIGRRAKETGLAAEMCRHMFFATGVAAYLDNKVVCENALAIASKKALGNGEAS